MDLFFGSESSGRSTADFEPLVSSYEDQFGKTDFVYARYDHQLTGKLFLSCTNIEQQRFELVNGLTGSMDAMRRRNSRCIDYTGLGYIGISTRKPKAAPEELDVNTQHQSGAFPPRKPEADFDFVAVLPVGPFLALMKEPIVFASLLQEKALEVMDQWRTTNSGRLPHNRVIVERSFTIFRYSFKDGKGVMQHSQYDMSLSTFYYTLNARKVETPEPLVLRDVKARTTAATNDRT